jgi:hypothetical protein
MWPEDLRGTFYFTVTWLELCAAMYGLFFLADPMFIGLYLVAWVAFTIGCLFTAGYGVAALAQARYDERRFRRKVKNELIGEK